MDIGAGVFRCFQGERGDGRLGGLLFLKEGAEVRERDAVVVKMSVHHREKKRCRMYIRLSYYILLVEGVLII